MIHRERSRPRMDEALRPSIHWFGLLRFESRTTGHQQPEYMAEASLRRMGPLWLVIVMLLSIPTTVAFSVPQHRLRAETIVSSTPSWISGRTDLSPTKSKVRVTTDRFWNAIQHDEADQLISLLAETVVWDDYVAMYHPIEGIAATEKYLRLCPPRLRGEFQLDDSVIGEDSAVLLLACIVTNRRSVVWLSFSSSSKQEDRIQEVRWIQEPSNKTGEVGLKILSVASNFLNKEPTHATGEEVNLDNVNPIKLTLPEQYFSAWNERDMKRAVDLYSTDVVYDDTAFPKPLVGRSELEKHLNICARCFPSSFSFHADEVTISVEENGKLAARWHVENNGVQLPFTRGISVYSVNKQGKISNAVDFVDGTFVKTKPLEQFLQLSKAQISIEPIRLIPASIWAVYMYIVFLSDGILPGANALQLEQRTWEEVFNLSLNFFLVAPVLHLPFSPAVHPMLEGVFNLLLSWAAMFAGFLSDDRRDKPNQLAALPVVVGMQFLTSAFLLPYLTTRTSETRKDITVKELSSVSRLTENILLGPAMVFVGSYSILWAFQGRVEEFGLLPERWATFMDLLSIDRVGSSFLVDLGIFALFQGWLVDDDLQRRGVQQTELSLLRGVAKYVPFFGLGVYLAMRPQIPER